MTNEELFQQIIEQQNRFINMLTNLIDKHDKLLEKSEGRIDRTNAMIEKLAECSIRHEELMQQITHEYCKHLDTLTGNRDEISRQNTMLLEIIKGIKGGINLNQNFND